MKKIVIIGPESTGKSTLCEQLAQHYQTQWCEEYAREYLLQHGTKYSFEDLKTIAEGQLSLEDKYADAVQKAFAEQKTNLAKEPLLFIDTDMYVMKVWCEYVFGKSHNSILEQIAARKYDLYLLCNIDLPWVAEELREYPDERPRQELYRIYKDIMINQHVPWVEINGIHDERIQTAIKAVDRFVR
ncbi:MAG: ATP-binding protein [Filimonas sp.]|nr:ATP-binding protein [Filimonas sp.]